MTHPLTTPQAAKPGLPRLRPVVSCGVRAAALLALACFASLLVPLCVDVSSTTVNIQKSQAYADGEEPPLPSGAKELAYIDAMANESGLTSSDFVATTIGAITSTTGVVIAANPGVRLFDGSLGDNLGSLIEAADYPDWDTLSETQQASYGSKVNYDATKYVALMDAFDLSDGYERFQQTGSSGGGFVFTDNEANKLHRIGSIGKNWANRLGQSFGDVKDLMTEDYRNLLYLYLYGEASGGNDELQFNGEGMDNYTGGTVYYKLTNNAWLATPSGDRLWVNKVVAISDVYFSINNDSGMMFVYLFSKAPFTYGNTGGWGIDITPSRLSSNSTFVNRVPDKPYYQGFVGMGPYNASLTSSQTINSGGLSEETMAYMLYSDNSSSGGESGELTPDVPEYPETSVPDSTDIYYPPEGISPSTSWNQYITVQRPDNPFNPDDQTSTPEWQQETKQNVQGLQGIHFDKLFPFSMVYSIPNLVNVVRNGVANDSQAKNVVVVPFRWSDNYVDEIRLDLSDLVSLLVMVRPFNRVLLVFALLMALVLFWKSILTGD